MKKWHLIFAVVLIGMALFLILRDHDESPSDLSKQSEESRSEAGKGKSHSGRNLEESGRQTRSTRVLRERSPLVTTDSGLQYEILVDGSGEHPKPTDRVKVHYEGTLEDGSAFDSSYERGEATILPLDGVIPGWTEGIQLMRPGAKFRFVIPPGLAYGANGAGEKVPPNSTLIFKVELISIENSDK